MAVLDGAIANVALPTIATDLNASPASSIWIVNAYQIAIVIALLPLSFLGDMVGYRRIYKIGLVVFTITSLICASLPKSRDVNAGACGPGPGRRGADERQHGADSPDLSAAAARSRNGHQLFRRCRLLRRGPYHCRRDPLARLLAMAVFNQRAARDYCHRSCAMRFLPPNSSAQQDHPLRSAERDDERPHLRAAHHGARAALPRGSPLSWCWPEVVATAGDRLLLRSPPATSCRSHCCRSTCCVFHSSRSLSALLSALSARRCWRWFLCPFSCSRLSDAAK